jgi:CO/xanthine dehydrogenase FAD-binding subunit
MRGKKATENLLRQAAREALKDASPMTENGYKKELAEAVIYRAAMSLV